MLAREPISLLYNPTLLQIHLHLPQSKARNLDAHRADGARAAMLDHLTEVRETWVRHQDGAPA